MRWLETVEKDARGVNVKRWRHKAVGRVEWACVIKEVKAPRRP
jgi:hypothetical protein